MSTDDREVLIPGGISDPVFQDESSNYASYEVKAREGRLRGKLIFFFMNPIEKWKSKKRFPYKFLVQVVKIFLVTIQLCLFAHSRYNHVNYAWDNRIAFSHLFLRGWDPVREVYAYPPGMGPLALYNQKDFYDTIDYAFKGYNNINESIGPYSYANEDNKIIPPIFCAYYYKEGEIFGFNESYVFNSEIIEKCLNLTKPDSQSSADYIGAIFDANGIKFSSLVRVRLAFSIKTVNFKAAGPLSQPDCYKFKIKIHFNNEDMDGQMVLSLDADPVRLNCKGDVRYISDNQLDQVLRSVLNVFVILICALSFALCLRAIIRAQQLKYQTMDFFRESYGKELSHEGRWEFWNLWYIMILINDVLIIIGSCIKEEIERKQFVGDQWNTCSVYLGTGNLLVWFGVLRYLGFFKTYNVVILTLKKAFPKVARFLFCAILIYAGFTFCGWLILGPYHIKFRTLASTSECLFALINGDDMYATFSIMEVKSSLLWWYSRIYLYCFISLYIYVVLSLFISIIMDAYETIKMYYKEGFPKNDLQEFMFGGGDYDMSSMDEPCSTHNTSNIISKIASGICCCKT